MAHMEPNLRERRTIEDMVDARMSVREIAAEIGQHRSTVCRDLERNGPIDLEGQPVRVRHASTDRVSRSDVPQRGGTIHACVHGADGRSERLARHLAGPAQETACPPVPQTARPRRPTGPLDPRAPRLRRTPRDVRREGARSGDLRARPGHGRPGVSRRTQDPGRRAVARRSRSTTHPMIRLMGVKTPCPDRPADPSPVIGASRSGIGAGRSPGPERRPSRTIPGPPPGASPRDTLSGRAWRKGSVGTPKGRARRCLPRDAAVAALAHRDTKSICDGSNGMPGKRPGWRSRRNDPRASTGGSPRGAHFADGPAVPSSSERMPRTTRGWCPLPTLSRLWRTCVRLVPARPGRSRRSAIPPTGILRLAGRRQRRLRGRDPIRAPTISFARPPRYARTGARRPPRPDRHGLRAARR